MPSLAAPAQQCEVAVAGELCLAPGSRAGTFLLLDRRDGTIVASVPTNPNTCPDQTFDVTPEFPVAGSDPSKPLEALLNVNASSSTCSNAAPSRQLRLVKSEAHFGLAQLDLSERVYTPSIAAIAALRHLGATQEAKSDTSTLRPKTAVDSLTKLSGLSSSVTGKPCNRAKRLSKCLANYNRAIATSAPYGSTICGNCTKTPLSLVYTRRDEVGTVTDLKVFLGRIDSAGDAALLRNATAVWPFTGTGWIVARWEIDGTCLPLEYSDVYELVQADGSVEPLARLLTTRTFNQCI